MYAGGYKNYNYEMNKFPTLESIKTFFGTFMNVEEYVRESKDRLESIKTILEILMVRNMRKNEKYITTDMAEKMNTNISDSNDLTSLRMSKAWQEFMEDVEDIYKNSHRESR